jgi:hypothetical protein
MTKTHGIICSNDPMLCIFVRLGMANNLHFGCFPFLRIKSSFSFFSAKTRFFREATTKYMMFNWTKIFL